MPSKVYRVQAPDGSVINVEGPDNATPDEVKTQAKRLFAERQASSSTPAAKREIPSDASISAAPDTIGSHIAATLSMLGNKAGSGTGVRDTLDWLASKVPLNYNELKSTVRTGIGMVAGGAAAAGTSMYAPQTIPFGGPGIAASGTMAVIDQVMRKIQGEGTGGTAVLPDTPVGAAIEGAVGNEIGGRVLGVLGKGVKEAILPGSVSSTMKGMTSEMSNLKPTYGQTTGHELVENLFAKGAKAKSVTESTTAANTRLRTLVAQATGRAGDTSNEKLSEVMQAEIKQGFNNSLKASNAEAQNFLNIAETNQHAIPQPPQIVQSSIIGPNGQPIIQSIPSPPKIVKGPIYGNSTLGLIDKLEREIALSKVKPEPDAPILKALEELKAGFGAEYDSAGKLIAHEPISADEAWKTKQVIDKLGYGDAVENVNVTDSRFKQLSQSLNKDIDDSIKGWTNNAGNAAQSWEDTKAIVQARHETFSPLGETGGGTRTLLNTVNAPDPYVEAIKNDRFKLQRFLETGNMNVNGHQITSSNAKRDMQGYILNDIWDKGFSRTDPLNHTIGTANGAKMATDWIEFANSDQAKQLFSVSQIERYNDFFDAVRKTTQQPSASTRWITLNFGTRAVALGPALVAGGLTGGALGSAGVVGGAIGLSGVARIMANKKAAPVFLAMLHGRPLGTSFQAASRIVMQSLSGVHMSMQTKDGDMVEGVVGTDGIFRPVQK